MTKPAALRALLAFMFSLSIALAVEARKYDDIMESGYISIAVYRDFPPYSYRKNGVAAGVDIEVGKKLAERLGVRPQWFWLTADENLEDDLRNAIWKGHYLGGGVADVMLRVPYSRDFARMTDEFGELKNDQVVLLGPYHRERWTVARNTKRLPQLTNLAPFQFHRVGVEVDSVPDFTLTSSFGGRLVNNVVHYLTLLEAVDSFQRGEIPAVAGMRGAIEWRIHQSSSATIPAGGLSISDLAISDQSLVQWPRRAWDIGAAVKHTYRQLGYALEAELEAMAKDGDVAAIFNQFGMSFELPQYYRPETF